MRRTTRKALFAAVGNWHWGAGKRSASRCLSRTVPAVNFADRNEVLSHLIGTFDAAGVRWALQGPADAPQSWTEQSGTKDLDLWVAWQDRDAVLRLLDTLGGADVVSYLRQDWLAHHMIAVTLPGSARRGATETASELAVVDVTFGDLRIGPALLLEERHISTDGRRLTGAAAAIDLAVRPLLKARPVEPERQEQARWAWQSAPDGQRAAARAALSRSLGAVAAAQIIDGLAGQRDCDTAMARSVAAAYRRRALHPRHWVALLRQSGSLLSRRHRGPLDRTLHGVLVTVLGTDGAGKSTVTADLHAQLGALRLPATEVYMGMARGNLPGVALARRLLHRYVQPAPPSREQPSHELPPREQSPETPSRGAAPSASPATTRLLLQIAAWALAVEYGWRGVRLRKALRRGHVVLCDRYAEDLALMPACGSRAWHLAALLLPTPQVRVHVSADPEIVAERLSARGEVSPGERDRAVQRARAQQQWYDSVLRRDRARALVVRTDDQGSQAAQLTPVISAVLHAAHRQHVHPRPAL